MPLCEFYLMAVSDCVSSMHINLPFPQAESKEKEEIFFQGLSTLFHKCMVCGWETKVKEVRTKLLYGMHQKISTVVLKSKITEDDCHPERMMML